MELREFSIDFREMMLKMDVELCEVILIFIGSCLLNYLVYEIIRYTYIYWQRRSVRRQDQLTADIEMGDRGQRLDDQPPSYDFAIFENFNTLFGIFYLMQFICLLINLLSPITHNV